MSEDKPDLVKIVELACFENGDEVLLIHRKAMYAVHGIVKGIDENQSFLEVHDRIRLDYGKMEIEGKAGMITRVDGTVPSDAQSLYNFLRDNKGYRTEATLIFPGNGLWEAYKIVDEKPEQEAAPSAESAEPMQMSS